MKVYLTLPQIKALISAANHVLAGEAGDVEDHEFPPLERACESLKNTRDGHPVDPVDQLKADNIRLRGLIKSQECVDGFSSAGTCAFCGGFDGFHRECPAFNDNRSVK